MQKVASITSVVQASLIAKSFKSELANSSKDIQKEMLWWNLSCNQTCKRGWDNMSNAVTDSFRDFRKHRLKVVVHRWTETNSNNM